MKVLIFLGEAMAEKEVIRSILKTLSDITEKEKRKSMEKEDYARALVLSVIEGLWKAVEKELEQ